jgi:dienelactone hydrolase
MGIFKGYKEKFSPSYFQLNLTDRAPKSLAFSAENNFKKWQGKARRQLKQLTGPVYKDAGQVKIKVLETEKRKGYTFKKILFPTRKDVINNAYLLIPDTGQKKYPAMVCLQGHSSGVHISIGKPKSKHDKEEIAGDRDFAVQAVNNGYVALAVEQRCFGEREEKRLKHKMNNRCWDATMHALMLGHTLIAERITDVMRGIDLLSQLPLVDKSKIGCMGNSGGGTITFYAACLDKRIKVAVPSCSFCTYEDSIMQIGHCMDNYIPGVLQYFGMEDLTGLIAPRYLVIVAGKEDSIFPIKGVREGYRKAMEIYKKAGVPGKVKLVVGPEGHRFYADLSWPVINKFFAQL